MARGSGARWIVWRGRPRRLWVSGSGGVWLDDDRLRQLVRILVQAGRGGASSPADVEKAYHLALRELGSAPFDRESQ